MLGSVVVGPGDELHLVEGSVDDRVVLSSAVVGLVDETDLVEDPVYDCVVVGPVVEGPVGEPELVGGGVVLGPVVLVDLCAAHFPEYV